MSNEQAYSGNRSLKVSATGGGYNSNMLSYNLGAQSSLKESLYGRMMIRLSDQNSKSADFTFIQADGAPRAASGAPAGTNVMYRGRVDGRNDHFMANYDTWNQAGNWTTDCWKHPQNINPAPQDYLIPKNTWACVQWHFDASKNTLQFWLNDKELSQIQVIEQGDGCVASNTQNNVWWGPEAFGSIKLGIEQYHGHAQARTMYIDDIAIDDRFVSCPVEPGASSSSSSSSSAPSSSSSSSSSSSTPVVIGDAPVANGLCAANTGLGGGTTSYAIARAVLNDGSAVVVSSGNQVNKISFANSAAVTDAIAITNGTYASASENGFCLIRSNGAIHCGKGSQLFAEETYTPQSPAKAAIAIQGKTQNGATCALLADNSVICANEIAPPTPTSAKYIAQSDIQPINHLACFRDNKCCGITLTGELECWGAQKPSINLPHAKATFVTGGDSNSCAVYDDGNAYCWGEHWGGQTGQPSNLNFAPSEMARVPLNESVIAAVGGQHFNCWLHNNGSVSCAGSNSQGGNSTSPVKIQDTSNQELQNLVALSGGRDFACAAKANGDLYCWGSMSGQGVKAVKVDLGGATIRMPAQCMN